MATWNGFPGVSGVVYPSAFVHGSDTQVSVKDGGAIVITKDLPPAFTFKKKKQQIYMCTDLQN